VSIEEAGSCVAQFDRTSRPVGVFKLFNSAAAGPSFNDDLHISRNCNENYYSRSKLGSAYGGDGVNPYELFGQTNFRVRDYEVFKSGIGKTSWYAFVALTDRQ
jgi:hypothetical protein